MVINYSEVESTVLDFFSGGIFAREALFSSRDVIYFANSEPEAIFVKEYGKALLRYSDRVRQWFQRYKCFKVAYLFEPVARSCLFEPTARSSFYEPAARSRRLLAPIETPIFWVPDLNQVLNPVVKASDLLPRKLLILDVEGLLVYDEGFMDRSSKTAAKDVVGTKKVIRRNGVQEFITRCLELFDIALWTCSDRNLLYDYTYYLFSGEQYSKFLFRWDQGKALDTKERWTRNNREIRLVLKPLKTIWETFPDFNARNTLLVDVNPYRASANPEDTGIFPAPYTGSYNDKYLITVLLSYLEGISQCFDVREYVREHVLQGSQRPLHFRATSRGLLGLLHKYSLQAIETYIPPLLTRRSAPYRF
ncbi:hypothetical protein R1sor_023986 [Riccia sorocarpa]|uniref:Mitochondrial import inner membrane translocase subunit TIM50 n=1 Tax=Riccia sorocarpa TaxID=122646 RepID=A0ABD3GP74_9MARC